jgi:hypothetical protein
MRKAAVVALAFAFTIVVPAFAQNYMSAKAQTSVSASSTVGNVNSAQSDLHICASQIK